MLIKYLLNIIELLLLINELKKIFKEKNEQK